MSEPELKDEELEDKPRLERFEDILCRRCQNIDTCNRHGLVVVKTGHCSAFKVLYLFGFKNEIDIDQISEFLDYEISELINL